MTEAIGDFKHYFSGFGGRAYLDCAAQGPFPAETVEAIRAALRYKEHPEEIGPDLFETLPARARAAAARLIACHPSSITLGTGASHGLNVAALGLPLKSGDEVLIGRGEFPAVVLPFMNLAAGGVHVRLVPPAAGRSIEAEDLIAAIGPRTRAIAVSLVAFATGHRIDLHALGEACRERGLFLVVDGAQGVGAVEFHVADAPIDILAVSGYKWLLGPYGTGFTYVSPRIVDRMRVAFVNWQTVEGATQLNRPFDYVLRFREGACRFDTFETASFLNLAGFTASLEFLSRVRVATIEAHATRLLDRLIQGLAATGLSVVSDLRPGRRSTILALEGAGLDATRRAWKRLADLGIVVGLRDNLIRVAPGIYNSSDDIDRLLEALRSPGQQDGR